MLELLLCSILTILPDYLVRRYVQGRRIGREITFFTMWYQLRWGIVGCLLLTITLITVIFYFHPSTTRVVSFYRTIPIYPAIPGRVVAVDVGIGDRVEAGQPLFRLDDAALKASVETARRRIAEADAALELARTDVAVAEAQIAGAESAYRQALDELETKRELRLRNPSSVPEREIERLQNLADGRLAQLTAARENRRAAETRLTQVLPAQKATAEASLVQAEVELDKTVVVAGVTGTVEQFALQVGDYINPFTRPAGILIPEGAGRRSLQAGFGQIEAQVIRPGMVAEVTCASVPFTIIPMLVTGVQPFFASGQVQTTGTLIDPAAATAPGTLVVFLEPLYAGGIDRVTPGSRCIANAYTNNYDRLAGDDLGTMTRLGLHAVDTVGIVHAMLLRIQALLLPVRTLVLSGH